MHRSRWVLLSLSLIALGGLGWALWSSDPEPTAEVASSPSRPAHPSHRATRADPGSPSTHDEVDAGPRFHLVGEVVEAHAPAPQVEILVDGIARTRSDANGHFELELAHLPATVHAREGARASAYVVVGALPRTELVLRLQPVAVLRGVVRDRPSGEPIAGAKLVVRGGDETATTDAEGRFTLAVGADRNAFDLSAPGHVTRRFEQPLRAGAELELTLALDPAVTLSGRVVDGAGEGIPGVALEAAYGSPGVIAPEPVTTGPQGDFTIAGLASGPVSLTLKTEGFAPAWAYFTAPASALKLIMRRGAEVSGRVLDGTGAPVSGAHLTLSEERPGRELSMEPKGVELPSADSDAEGHYDLRGIPAGTYSVSASHPGLGPLHHAKLTLADESFQALDLHFPSGGRTVQGSVVDAVSGKPLAGAEARINGLQWWTFTTGADGRFTFSGVSQRPPLSVWATAAGHLPSESAVPDAGGEVTVALASGLEVKGRVVDEDGAPLTRFHIGPKIFTPADGRFELHLPLDVHALTVAQVGHRDAQVTVVAPAPGQVLDLGEVILRETPEVTVEVRDPAGKPVSGAEVYNLDSSQAGAQAQISAGLADAMGVTDATGTLRLHLQPAPACLVALHPGYAPSADCPQVVTEQGGRFTLKLVAGAWIHGHVFEGGRPLAGAMVTLEPGSSLTITGSDGSYRFGPLTPGHKTVTQGGAPDSPAPPSMGLHALDLKAGQDAVVDFGSARDGQVSVHAFGIPSGHPTIFMGLIPGPPVTALPNSVPDGLKIKMGPVRSGEASVTLSGPEGPATVFVSVKSSTPPRMVPVQILSGQVRQISVDLSPGAP